MWNKRLSKNKLYRTHHSKKAKIPRAANAFNRRLRKAGFDSDCIVYHLYLRNKGKTKVYSGTPSSYSARRGSKWPGWPAEERAVFSWCASPFQERSISWDDITAPWLYDDWEVLFNAEGLLTSGAADSTGREDAVSIMSIMGWK